MFRPFNQNFSPTKSTTTIEDLEQRLNAVINANEKLTLLLKEKINENEQLKENRDILYKNNQELQEINIELCDQITIYKNGRCTPSHAKNTYETEREILKLKELINQKDQQIANFQQRFEDDLQLELSQKEYVEKIKELEEQNQQLIYELDLVTKKLIESQRGSVSQNYNKRENNQYQEIIEDLSQQVKEMRMVIYDKDQEILQSSNKELLVQMEQLQVDKISCNLQLEEQKKVIQKLTSDLEEKHQILEQLKKYHNLNSTKNEILQKQQFFMPQKLGYLKNEQNVFDISEDIETTVKRQFNFDNSTKNICGGQCFSNTKSPRSYQSDQEIYMNISDKLQSELTIKEKQCDELNHKKQMADIEIQRLSKLIRDQELTILEKQKLIDQLNYELKNSHQNIKKRDVEQKKTLIKQQDEFQIVEEKLDALENLRKEEQMMFEKQIGQAQNQLKQKEIELRKFQEQMKEKLSLQQHIQVLLDERKEIEQNLEQKIFLIDDQKNKIHTLEQQLKLKDAELKNQKEKKQNQSKIYDLDNQIVQLKLEIEQHILNAEATQQIIEKNEQQLQIKEFQIQKLQEQLKESNNRQMELITSQELENQKNYQQIDELNEILNKQDFEIKKLQSLVQSRPLDKSLLLQQEQQLLKQQIDQLIMDQTSLQQENIILESQLKGKDQEIHLQSQKSILASVEFQNSMRKQETDFNGKLIEKEQKIQVLLQQIQELQQQNEALQKQLDDLTKNLVLQQQARFENQQKEEQLLELQWGDIQKQIECMPLNDDNTTVSDLNSHRMEELKTFAAQLESQPKSELIKELLEQKVELLKKGDEYNMQNETLNRQNQQLQEIQLETESLKAQIQQKEEDLKDLQSAKQQQKNQENQIKTKEQQIKKLQDENKELKQAVQNSQQLKKQNDQQKSENQQLQDTVIAQDSQIKQKEDALKKSQEQVKDLNKKIDQLQRETNQNKNLQQELDKFRTQLFQKDEELKQLQQQLLNSKKQEENIQKQQQQFEKESKLKKEEKERIQNELTQLKQEFQKSQQIAQNAKKLDDQNKKLQAQLDKDAKQKQEEVEKLQNEIAKSNQELKQLQQQLQNQKKNEDSQRKLQQSLDLTNEKLKKVQQDFEKKELDLKNQLKEANEQLQEWEQNDLSKDQEIEKLIKQIEEFKKKDQQFQKQGKTVKELQEQLKKAEAANNQLLQEKDEKESILSCQRDNFEQENKELKEQIVKLQKSNLELAHAYENIQYVDARKMDDLQRKIQCLESYYQQLDQKQNNELKNQSTTPRKQSRNTSANRNEDKIGKLTLDQLQTYSRKLELIIKEAGLQDKIN